MPARAQLHLPQRLERRRELLARGRRWTRRATPPQSSTASSAPWRRREHRGRARRARVRAGAESSRRATAPRRRPSSPTTSSQTTSRTSPSFARVLVRQLDRALISAHDVCPPPASSARRGKGRPPAPRLPRALDEHRAREHSPRDVGARQASDEMKSSTRSHSPRGLDAVRRPARGVAWPGAARTARAAHARVRGAGRRARLLEQRLQLVRRGRAVVGDGQRGEVRGGSARARPLNCLRRRCVAFRGPDGRASACVSTRLAARGEEPRGGACFDAAADPSEPGRRRTFCRSVPP